MSFEAVVSLVERSHDLSGCEESKGRRPRGNPTTEGGGTEGGVIEGRGRFLDAEKRTDPVIGK